MARYRSRQQRTQLKNLLGCSLIIAVLAVVAALGYFWYDRQSRQQGFDAATLCPMQGSPAYVAVVFDKTDAYNLVQQRFLKRYFAHFKAQLQAGTHIALYVIDDREREVIAPDFEVCAPRSSEDANAWYENPKLIRQRWLERFEQPLDRVIAGFMQPGNADYSPIMEILQVVSLSAFPPAAKSAKKKIVIVSDMLQHTPEWSHYRGQMDFAKLRDTPYFQRIRTDLQGAEVEILYVRRDGAEKLQSKRHAYFWADFIDAIGGKVTLIEKIDG
ncbi:hypothetical protein [Methylomarinum vadi]|uniref:hypothetical protein n=1 Tax=Methylomarinum vadi TaxID=438855 RepID=UPI0004DF7C46|nr:hypothetical protein [Methylomarinum vadi]